MAIDAEFWTAEAEQLRELLVPLITAAATNGAESALRDLAVQAGVAIDLDIVNTDAATWATKYAAQLAKGITETTRTQVGEAIGDWIESGKPLDALTADLSSLFSADRAEMIAITEVTRSYASGNQLAWQESGLVDGIRWMTVNDDLVCEICGPRDGQELPIDSDDLPPAHVRCRCYTQPIVSLPG